MTLAAPVAITIIVCVVGSTLATYMASNRSIKEVARTSNRTIKEITNDFSHKFIALSFARQAAYAKNRKLELKDLDEGLKFAEKALKRFEKGGKGSGLESFKSETLRTSEESDVSSIYSLLKEFQQDGSPTKPNRTIVILKLVTRILAAILAVLKALGKSFKECMIRPALPVRIIHFIKIFTKLIKGAVKSYVHPPIRWHLIILAVAIGLGGTLSYISASDHFLLGVLAFGTTLDDFDPNRNGPEAEDNEGRKTKEKDEKHVGREKECVGIIVAAVSSKKQVEEGKSIGGQIGDAMRIAERAGIPLPFDPIIIEGESGKDSVRKGLGRLLEFAEEGKITHVVCVALDRVGRHLPECLYFVYELRQHGVKILTSSGEMDVDEMEGLTRATFELLTAQWSIDSRTKAMMRSKIQNFKDGSYHLEHRPGYRRGSDGWEKEPGRRWEDFVVDMFEVFVEKRSYQTTADYLNENYEDLLESPISPNQVKKAVQDPVYIGEPTYKGEMVVKEYGGPIKVDEPNLAFIGNELFEKAKEAVRLISEKYSRNNDVADPEELTKGHGLKNVEELIPEIKLMCQECMCVDCPAEMVKNGTRPGNGRIEQVWMCRNRKHQKRIPTKSQLEDLEGTDNFCCPACGTLDNIEIQKVLDGTTNCECCSCGFHFRTDDFSVSTRR